MIATAGVTIGECMIVRRDSTTVAVVIVMIWRFATSGAGTDQTMCGKLGRIVVMRAEIGGRTAWTRASTDAKIGAKCDVIGGKTARTFAATAAASARFVEDRVAIARPFVATGEAIVRLDEDGATIVRRLAATVGRNVSASGATGGRSGETDDRCEKARGAGVVAVTIAAGPAIAVAS
jgi:hypothetical protein